jgi:hypothetical protein
MINKNIKEEYTRTSTNLNTCLTEEERILSYLFSKIAGTVRGVEDLIIKNREVECKAQPYGVSWCQLSKCDILCGHENLY